MTNEAGRVCLDILLVDDNPTDKMMFKAGLEELKVPAAVHDVEDGAEALAFLNRDGRHSAAPRPDIIVLDINLPQMNGHDVLARIKADRDLKTIPIFVMSGSASATDVLLAYSRHANSYLQKPMDFGGLLKVIEAIKTFWFTTAVLPPQRT